MSKIKKTYNKTRGEHIKDVIIAVLITSILAFAGGAAVMNRQQSVIDQKAQQAQAVKTVEVEPVKK